MRGDKGGARLAGGRSGGRGRDRGAGGPEAPEAGAGGRREPAVQARGAGFWRGGRRLGLGKSLEEERGRQAWGAVAGTGSKNDMRIKGRKG